MMKETDAKIQSVLFEYVLALGDDRLILGHRLSEWCGHGPILEEDIALANLSLDCLGQASGLLKLAGELEGAGRSEDDLAYFRDETDFKNFKLVELPRGDFAFTIARQFLFDTYSFLLFEQLQKSRNETLAGIAAKSVKEVGYHVRHAAEWMRRLGDGTEESHQRLQDAVDEMWRYTGELFEADENEAALVEAGYAADAAALKTKWEEMVDAVFKDSQIKPPETAYFEGGSRQGQHTEHLGHLLAEMQIVARSFPGAKW